LRRLIVPLAGIVVTSGAAAQTTIQTQPQAAVQQQVDSMSATLSAIGASMRSIILSDQTTIADLNKQVTADQATIADLQKQLADAKAKLVAQTEPPKP